MAVDIGPKIGIDGEADFRKSLQNINQQLKTLGSEMALVTSSFSENDDAQSRNAKQTQTLTKQIDAQREKTAMLSQMVQQAADKFGESNTKTLKWQQALNEATTELNKMEKELDEANEELDEMSDEVEESGSKFAGFKSVLSNIGGVIGGVAAAAGAATVAMSKQVIQSFGELEQNLGGSAAVFGSYSSDIQKAGEEAYKNLGVSQSEYLATANKMGALFQGSGIGQLESMQLTIDAMQRAADMASVMGIDLQTALDSVAGAAKGNFTMMDNLGVAMNATTIEAYAAAKGLDFIWAEASNAEKAQVAMQMFFEQTAQYSGNFARESTQTVSGSLGLLQASVASFTAGLGNADADMVNLTQNMVEAFKAVVDNIVPILDNIVAAIPMAADEILSSVGALLPALLETLTNIFASVLDTLLSLLPELVPVAVNAVITFVETIVKNLPLISEAGVQLVLSLIQGLALSLPNLIPAVIEAALTIVHTLIDNVDLMISAALALILGLADGLMAALPKISEKVPQIVVKVVSIILDNLPLILEAGWKLTITLIEGILNAIPSLLANVAKMVWDIKDTLIDGIKNYADIGKQMIEGIWEGLSGAGDWLYEKISGFGNSIVDAFKGVFGIHSPSKVFESEVGRYMAQGVGEGFTYEMQNVAKQMTRSIPTPEIAMNGAAAGMVNGLQTALTGMSGQTSSLTVVVKLDTGEEIAHAFLPNLRAAMKSDPEVLPA